MFGSWAFDPSIMKSFQVDNNGKMQAVSGAKDDRVLAFCMALEGIASGIYYI